MKNNIFETITNKLIQVIEQNDGLNWIKQWSNNTYCNPISGTKYRNTNYLHMMLDCVSNDRKSTMYCTFNQAKTNKWKVKKGAKSIPVVYYGSFQKEDEEGNLKNSTVLKYSNVFNFDDIEGDKSKYVADSTPVPVINDIQNYINNIKHDVTLGNPCYIPSLDLIKMPNINDFSSSVAYYSTYFHELSHWTSHKDRLDRKINTNFGSAEYAQEELVAELSAIFLCSEFNLSYEIEYHVSYLKSWLNSLKSEPNYLKTTLSMSSKVSNYLLSLKK